MADKVISLSSGLILGMVCALFLGIGSTQNIMPSSNFELPFNFEMTIAQYPHSTEQHVPEQEANTTPSVTPTVDSAEPNSGRITRIATLTITEDPVLDSQEQTPKINLTAPVPDNSLYMVNQQRSLIAHNTTTESTYSGIILITAKQSNFSSIADNSSGRSSGLATTPGIEGKPHTAGSPALAHNDPNLFGNPQEPPVITGKDNKPEPGLEQSSGDTDTFVNLPDDSYSDEDGGRPNSNNNRYSARSGYSDPQLLSSHRRQFN